VETTARPLTEKETAALGEEYRLLTQKLEQQTSEQVTFLRLKIADDPLLPDATKQKYLQLLAQGGFKLKLFRVTNTNAQQQQQIQVTYDIHDDLFEYLTSDTVPQVLKSFLRGGSVLPQLDKATAEDPSPLTGKTRTGIKKYDDIIAAQEGKKS